MASRILGLVREQVLAHAFGASHQMDFPSRNHAQKAKQPAISKTAAPKKARIVVMLRLRATFYRVIGLGLADRKT